jgi:anti-sigma-K factor RskA
MNYGDPTLRDHLAAEYALGTLRGAARRRFERLMAADPGLRALAAAWESRLNPLAESAEAIAPPAAVWRRIDAGLGPAAVRPLAAPRRRSWAERLFGRPQQPIPTMATAGMWYCVGLWRMIGLGGTALAVALALYLGVGQPTVIPPPTHIAVLAAADGAAVLVARLDAGSGRLALTPVALPQVDPAQSLELWLLPPDGTAPRSLGLIDASIPARDLPESDIGSLTAGALAVSLEPAGGSPTGQPTGPVLYSGPVLPAT